MVKSGAALILTPNTLTGRRLSGSTDSHEQDRIADHMHDGVDSIAMRVRVIAELAMEIVSHADLRGANAVPLPNVFAAVPDCTNASTPTAVENRTGGSLLARRTLQTPVKRETKLASNNVCSWPRLCEKSHGCYDSFLNRQAGATDVRLCGRD